MLRDVNRIDEMLEDLKTLWKTQPDLRLGQVVTYVALLSGWKDTDLFYVEDDAIGKQLKMELRKIGRHKDVN